MRVSLSFSCSAAASAAAASLAVPPSEANGGDVGHLVPLALRNAANNHLLFVCSLANLLAVQILALKLEAGYSSLDDPPGTRLRNGLLNRSPAAAREQRVFGAS